MAAEEIEYFSPTVSSGASGVRREAPSRAPSRTPSDTNARKQPTNKVTPFVQGATLGVVLMIPFGVWWWSQSSPAAVVENPADAQTAASKLAKPALGAGANNKKKAYRPPVSAAKPRTVPEPGRIHQGPSEEVQNAARPSATVEPPATVQPRPLATEIPPPPAAENAPASTEGKKSFLKTLTSPFRKSKPKITGVEE
jgi:hypothetical protein